MIIKKEINRDFHWMDVQGPSESELEGLRTRFELPYLLIQDVMRPEHLPKFEETDSGCFLMLRSFDVDARFDGINVQDLTRKIAIFIRDNTIITIHRAQLNYLDQIEERAQKSLHPKTIEALVHQLIIAVIRSYEKPLDRLQDMYDDFEQEILANKAVNLSMKKVYHFRRQLFIYKRLLKQSSDAILRFREYWPDQTSIIQDIKENIDHMYFEFDEISDNFDHLFQVHVSLNDQRSNEVMKVLTIFSSIILPLNFIASFYGMNFVHLPGLHSVNAFIGVLSVMLIISLATYWFFKSQGWFKTTKE
jgi:magnesium transporter